MKIDYAITFIISSVDQSAREYYKELDQHYGSIGCKVFTKRDTNYYRIMPNFGQLGIIIHTDSLDNFNIKE